MRKDVADWMLEVCEAEATQPEVFCLAMNYMDRFLSLVKISPKQLQLLGSVCLLVACKVRQHSVLAASKLVEYSDFNLDVLNIMVSTNQSVTTKKNKKEPIYKLVLEAVWFWLDS